MNSVDVLVVGGGISGLATAHLLEQAGVSVELWEQSERPGGKIASDRQDGYLFEQSASFLFNFRPEVDHFVSGSRLEQHKVSLNPAANRYLIHKGRLAKLPLKLVPMISAPIWSLRGRLRLLLEPFIPSGYDENESVGEFIRRRLGKEFLERTMEPFIAGTLASDAEQANAAATLPRLTALERRYGNLTLGVLAHKLFGQRSAIPSNSYSFRGGMATLVDTLANSPGIRLRNGLVATELIPGRQGWVVVGQSALSEQTIRARHVVLSVPAHAAARLTGALDTELQSLLSGIEYTPISVIHTGFAREAVQHPLDGNGFLFPRETGLASTGCLWMSSLFPDRAPQGKVLLSNYLGGARRPAAAYWDDEYSIDMIMHGLRRLLGIRADPEMVRIHRHEQGLPLYHGAYPARMKAITGRLHRLPALHLEANYRGGVSVRDRILCACATTERILSSLERIPEPVAEKVQWSRATVCEV